MATATKPRTTPAAASGHAQPAELPPINFARVRAHNLKSLEFLDVLLNGHSVVFSGSNACGKTTATEAFLLGIGQMAGKEIPEAVLKGKEEADIDIDLAHAETKEPLFHVHRDCVKNAWKPIKVTDLRTGETLKRGQETMDAFIDRIALRPFQFLDQRSQDQVDHVLRVCRVPLPVEAVQEITGARHAPVGDETAAQYLLRLSGDTSGKYFVDRAVIGREWEQKKKALLDQRQKIDQLPALPAGDTADVATLQAQVAALDVKREKRRALEAQWNRERPALQAAVARAQEQLDENEATLAGLPAELQLAEFQVKGTEAEIARLQKRLLAEREAVAKVQARIAGAGDIIAGNHADLTAARAALDDAMKAALAAVAAIPDPTPQITELNGKIASIDQRRTEIAKRQALEDLFERLRAEEAEAAQKHARAEIVLTQLRDLRRHLLDKIDLGVVGLEVGEGELRFNGVPFKEQASKSQQLRIAYALARLRNPTARFMFLDDAERFDAMGRAGLLADAKRDGIQMIMAVVRDDACTKCDGRDTACAECSGTGRVNAPLAFQII